MVRKDCKFCGENVFDVVDIKHLDTLPRTWVCSGCGREYTGELNDLGELLVYQKGYKPKPRQPQKTAAPVPGSEIFPEPEVVSAPGPEEPTEEPPEEVAAEEPEPGEPAEGME